MKVYPDTSVFGGCFDKEFRTWSLKLFEEFRSGVKTASISDLTIRELEEAPEAVRELIDGIPEAYREFLLLDDEARDLAEKYVEAKACGPGQLVDAQHIALATVNGVQVLASWNFRHIVNVERIRRYHSVNVKFGYPLIEIRSPREVIHEEG